MKILSHLTTPNNRRSEFTISSGWASVIVISIQIVTKLSHLRGTKCALFVVLFLRLSQHAEILRQFYGIAIGWWRNLIKNQKNVARIKSYAFSMTALSMLIFYKSFQMKTIIDCCFADETISRSKWLNSNENIWPTLFLKFTTKLTFDWIICRTKFASLRTVFYKWDEFEA